MLANLPDTRVPDLLVGYETADDAAVYALDAERAIVSTADFITPILDDPETFGRVAAANSLSDVYAMGGRPLMALNLCGYPQGEVPPAVIGEIFAGAATVCREAGACLAGGHTVRDSEVKFGLSVTGLVHPERILRNDGARPGDLLVLSKPLGTGALAAALKKKLIAPGSGHYDALVATMTGLNAAGAGLAERGARAATDVTGFGLAGHAMEMARGSGVALHIDSAALPLLPDAVRLCAEGCTCGGTKANAEHIGESAAYADGLPDGMHGLINDPQTSGGLLIAVPPKHLPAVREHLEAAGAACAAVIGEAVDHVADGPILSIR